MDKNKLINLSEEILLSLLHIAKTPIKAFFDTPYKCRVYRKSFYPRLMQLEKSGYVQRKKNSVVLTHKGNRRAEYIKWRVKKVDFKTWDGKWRILSFDVPENKKCLRENLRRKLCYLNFVRLHDSLWITPLPIEKEINELLKILEIRYFIRHMVVEKINFDTDLRRKFFGFTRTK